MIREFLLIVILMWQELVLHTWTGKVSLCRIDDADFIMKEQMAKIFSELLKEYRSRGVGFIIADQSPDNLFKDVTSQPSIRIIFREDFPNNTLVSEDLFERQMLTQLENRLALVINGATGEKYLTRTIDFKLI